MWGGECLHVWLLVCLRDGLYMWVCESNGNDCFFVCVCVAGFGELKRLNEPSDIYVFYYGEGGGVKSPDPECCVCYCRLPLNVHDNRTMLLGTDFLDFLKNTS